MNATKRIKDIAHEQGIPYSTLAIRSGYKLPHHLWRALDNPSIMQLGRVRKLARFLKIDIIDMMKMLK